MMYSSTNKQNKKSRYCWIIKVPSLCFENTYLTYTYLTFVHGSTRVYLKYSNTIHNVLNKPVVDLVQKH